jgi:hypothetical protein
MALFEISSVLTILEKATKVAQGILNMGEKSGLKKEAVELQNIITSLHSQILTMYAQYSELVQVKNNLEKKLVEYEDWNETESQYELKEVAPGVFVFSLKEDNRTPEPNHWLCTNCFYDRKKSILQRYGTSKYLCPRCKTEIIIPPGQSWEGRGVRLKPRLR